MAESGPIPVREGELVAGKYRVEGVIGVGGMGVVVSALHEQLDQRVAIKFVRTLEGSNAEAVHRFLREARAAVKLRSEHAARVLDVGTLDSGVPYMVMELLEGNDLAQVLAARGPLPFELTAEWMAQICEALAEAHAAGIVHRDLKPQNLFLARTVGGAEHVKVLDFGVSKSAPGLGSLTNTSAMLGSPLYMAPEQMRSSRDVDARADVWALGVVLFELLTQRFPFEAETLPDLCLKVVSDAPRLLSDFRPDVPETMVQVVARCLEKNRADRFANAAELVSALEPIVPAYSRKLVERAQLAMSGAPAITTSTLQSGEKTATPAAGQKVPTPAGNRQQGIRPTPASWDSARGVVASERRGARTTTWWVGAGGLATVAIGAFLLFLSRRPEKEQAHGAVSPGMASLSAASPATAPASKAAVAPVLPAVTLAPTAVDVAPFPADAASTATSKSTPPLSRIAPTFPPSAPATSAAVTRGAMPVRSANASDDIPALR